MWSVVFPTGVQRNLIVQFANDTIDESPRLKQALEANPVAAPQLAYRVLPGDHTRPLLQTVCSLFLSHFDCAAEPPGCTLDLYAVLYVPVIISTVDAAAAQING